MKDSCFKNDTGRFYCDEIGMITVFFGQMRKINCTDLHVDLEMSSI